MMSILLIGLAAFVGTALAELLIELVFKRYFRSEVKKLSLPIVNSLPMIDKVLKKPGRKPKKV